MPAVPVLSAVSLPEPPVKGELRILVTDAVTRKPHAVVMEGGRQVDDGTLMGIGLAAGAARPTCG